jgi:tetratricopeptide (TPR) repeat protein
MPFQRLLRVAAALALALLRPAHAQIDATRHMQDWEQCTNSDARTALEACKTLIDSHIDPPAQLAAAFNSRGVAHYTRGEIDLALADFVQALRLRPGYATALNNRATVYASRHEYDLAIKDFTEVLRLNPDPTPGFSPANTLASRANVYALQGDYEHSIQDFTEVLRLKPTDAETYFKRGNVYSRQNDYTHALEDYEKSLALKPGSPDVVAARDLAAQHTGHAAAKPAMPSLPACEALPANSPLAAPSYFDDSADHLRKIIPELKSLQPEAADSAKTASILTQTSASIASMLPKIPNLVAREEVQRTVKGKPTLTQVPARGARGRSPGSLNEADYDTPTRETTTVYTYRIVHRGEPYGGQDLDELRTDAKNRPLADSDNAQNVGFGALWLLFAPVNLPDAHFRFLGRQKLNGHETFVLSFAQLPDKARLGSLVGPASARCNTFIQGVAWIDQATFHIVRMQTDLLAPIPAIQVMQIRSILRYTEVKIPERALSLWLPADVVISWKQGTQDDSETHRYSKYRLFSGTARLIPITDPQ